LINYRYKVLSIYSFITKNVLSIMIKNLQQENSKVVIDKKIIHLAKGGGSNRFLWLQN